jgi:membrane protein YdbS with pleckstrin-like domain
MGYKDDSKRRVYSGIWAVMARWFKVPEAPPTLSSFAGDEIESFRPSPGFLDYLKFQFWLGLLAVDIGLIVLWIVLLVNEPTLGVVLAPLFVIAIVAPDILAYFALHLRYDTTWYVMSSRSIRLRRGIWVIRETTITFENVQNVEFSQGPLQRHFGIANLIVQTAGGGGGGGGRHPQQGQTAEHTGLIEGIAEAERIRDVIMNRVRQSRRAGLGDERPATAMPAARGPAWTPAHLEALREILKGVRGVSS